jgi:hypothetical protein
VYGAVFVECDTECRTIPQALTIDKHHHVLSQVALIVQHITGELRIAGKRVFKRVL